MRVNVLLLFCTSVNARKRARARGSVLGVRDISRALPRLLSRPRLLVPGHLGAGEQRRAGPALPAIEGIVKSKVVLSGVCLHRERGAGWRER